MTEEVQKWRLNANDMIWSDTLIKVIVPSTNDTFRLATGALIASRRSRVGSGPVWLINNDGEKDSTAPVTVFYSFTNRSFGSGSSLLKVKQLLIQKDTPIGYKFYVDSAMWNNPSIKGCVFKAIRDWKCLTGVNWRIDTMMQPPSDSATIDGKNLIQFGYTKHDTTGVVDAVTNTNAKNCSSTVYTSEIDMVFSNIVNWWFDTIPSHSVPTGMQDFYHTILHELGHAHSLNHVMDTNNIMFFDEFPGPIAAANRRVILSADASCDFGGNYVMDVSTTAAYSGCISGQVLPIIQQYICSPFTSINSIDGSAFNLSIYPNPFSDNFIIEYKFDHPCMMDMNLTDIQGRVIESYPTAQVSEGGYKMEIKTTDLSSGSYFINGRINGQTFYRKIICIH